MYKKSLQLITYYDFWDRVKKERLEENKKIREKIKEFKSQFSDDFKMKKKIEYLETEKQGCIDSVKYYFGCYKRGMLRKEPKWLIDLKKENYNNEINKIKKINTSIYFLKNPKNQKENKVNDEMIARAKKFPIQELVETDSNGFAICPFHDDNNPSLYTKNNFFHCFVCNWSGDGIKFLMERDDLTFVEAVKKLACG